MNLLLIAGRYAFSPSNRHRAKAVRTALGMMLSTLLLIVSLSVMDYLQNARFSLVKEIKSFPLAVISADVEEIRKETGSQVFLYKEMPSLLANSYESAAVTVRFIDENYEGGLMLSAAADPSGALLGYPNSAFSSRGTLSYLDKGKAATRVIKTLPFETGGYFRTELGSDFDSYYVFLPLSMAPETAKSVVAILSPEADLESRLKAKGYETVSWKEAESTLYQAMLMEKAMMAFVLSFLFILLLVQVNTDSRLFLDAKGRELAELRILGLERRKAALSFALSGAFTAALGCLAGFVLSKPVLLLTAKGLSLPSEQLETDVGISLLLSLFSILLSFLLYYSKSLKKLGKTAEIQLYE
jgi:ABC-type transport system, involved in lipoprotein release, permease component